MPRLDMLPPIKLTKQDRKERAAKEKEYKKGQREMRQEKQMGRRAAGMTTGGTLVKMGMRMFGRK